MTLRWILFAALLALFPASGARAAVRPAVYALEVEAHPADRLLRVSGTVTLQAARGGAPIVLSLTGLAGHVTARAGAAPVEILPPGGAQEAYRLRIPRPAGRRALTISFSYALRGGPAPLYYVGPEIVLASGYGTDWYPAVEGGSRAVGRLTFRVPPGQRVVAEGARRSTAAEEARGVFRFAETRPTYFTFLAGRFTPARRPGAVPLEADLLIERPRIGAFLDGVQSILGVLRDEFGPYPADRLTLVEVPREIAQQAGFNAFAARGMLVLNHRAFDVPDIAYLYEWLGHEIGHQWFPHAVALATPPGRYMEEALAEYGGLRVVERLAGAAAAEEFRRTGYAADPVYGARQYFSLAAAGCDRPLGNLPRGGPARDLAYNKGFLVWDALAGEIGRPRFRRALARIVARHRFGEIGWRAFLGEIERGAGRDLDPLYAQWFDRAGLPDWTVDWRQDGNRVDGTLTQAAPYYQAGLEVELRGAGPNEVVTRRVDLQPARETAFALPAPFRVTALLVDPHYRVPHWTAAYRAQVRDAPAARC